MPCSVLCPTGRCHLQRDKQAVEGAQAHGQGHGMPQCTACRACALTAALRQLQFVGELASTYQTTINKTLPVGLQTVTSRIPWLFAGQQDHAGPVMYLSGPQTAISMTCLAIEAVYCITQRSSMQYMQQPHS